VSYYFTSFIQCDVQAITAALEFDDVAITLQQQQIPDDGTEDVSSTNNTNTASNASDSNTVSSTTSNSSSSFRDKSEWSLGALASLIRVKTNAVKALRLGAATAIINTMTAYRHKVSNLLLLLYDTAVVCLPIVGCKFMHNNLLPCAYFSSCM
jgi:hypothetical protein